MEAEGISEVAEAEVTSEMEPEVGEVYRCDMAGCGYKTHRKWNLERHLVKHGKQKQKAKKCQSCHKSFTDKYELRMHQEAVHENMHYTCEICSAVYKTRQGLNQHIHVHEEKYRYTCSMCDRKFNNKSHFLTHFSKHMGVKLFACTQCDKKFSTNSSLNVHTKTCHEGIASSYPCDECSLSFTRKSCLKEHKKGKHGASVNFRCVCGKAYAWRASFNRHKQSCLELRSTGSGINIQ